MRNDVLKEDAGQAGFRMLMRPPFNSAIRICQAAIWFGDRLYVGGGRGPLQESAPGGTDHLMGAQIAVSDLQDGQWQLVHDSPLDGTGKSRDRSVWAFAAFQGRADRAPALYAAVGSLQGQVVLLRSEDGARFEVCGPEGLGKADWDIAAVRNLCVLDGRLYTSPVGKNRGRGWAHDNVANIPVVMATDAPGNRGWDVLSVPGFGDAENELINEMVAFNGTIYAATLNRRSGFQLWRASVPDRSSGTEWVKILDCGAQRGPASPVPAAMAVHDGSLYVGGSDWGFWPTYLPRGNRPRPDISATMQAWLRQETQQWRGSYGLWSSTDGVTWSSVTQTGIGGRLHHYGVREMVSTPLGLIVIPAAKTGEAGGGGIEIWLRERSLQGDRLRSVPGSA